MVSACLIMRQAGLRLAALDTINHSPHHVFLAALAQHRGVSCDSLSHSAQTHLGGQAFWPQVEGVHVARELLHFIFKVHLRVKGQLATLLQPNVQSTPGIVLFQLNVTELKAVHPYIRPALRAANMASCITLPKAQAELQELIDSMAILVRAGLELWLQVMEDLPFQRQNQHAAPALEAVQTALQQAPSPKDTIGPMGAAWLQQHLPVFSPTMTAHMQTQIDLMSKRVDVLKKLHSKQQLVGAEGAPTKLVTEAAAYKRLHLVNEVLKIVKPLEGVNEVLTEYKQSQREQRSHRHHLSLPESLQEANDLLEALHKWLAHWWKTKMQMYDSISTIEEGLESVCSAYSYSVHDYEDLLSMFEKTTRWSGAAAINLVYAALNLPVECFEHRCAEAILGMVDWRGFRAVVHIPGVLTRQVEKMRNMLCRVLARRDLARIFGSPCVPRDILPILLHELGVACEHMQAVGIPPLVQRQVLEVKQRAAGLECLPCQAPRRRKAPAVPAKEECEVSEPDDVQVLLRMMYGTSKESS